jgi:lactate dehydrogenase-like 2-hydroxyacid dehydrogenase
MKPKVYVTRPILPAALERIGQETSLRTWSDEVPVPPDLLHAEAQQVAGLVSYGKGFPLHGKCDLVDEALLDLAPHLRTIAIYGDGIDNVACRPALRVALPLATPLRT